MRLLERTGSAYRKQVAQIPRASGDEIDPPQPSSRLRRVDVIHTLSTPTY